MGKGKKIVTQFFVGQIDVRGLRTPFLFLEWIGIKDVYNEFIKML
jgi:hypothetical protein